MQNAMQGNTPQEMSQAQDTEINTAQDDTITEDILAKKLRERYNEVRDEEVIDGAEGSYKKKSKKPYAKRRPRYGKGQIDIVWENAKRLMGKVLDPSGKEIFWDRTKSRNGQWDMGHIPEEKYSVVHKLYMDDKISLQTFLKRYRDPNNYRPELQSTNRSHKYE